MPSHGCFLADHEALPLLHCAAHQLRLLLLEETVFRAGVGFSFVCFQHFRLDPDCGVQLLAGKWEDGTAVYVGLCRRKLLRVLSETCRNRVGIFSWRLRVGADGFTVSLGFLLCGIFLTSRYIFAEVLWHSRTQHEMWWWDDRVWYRLGAGMFFNAFAPCVLQLSNIISAKEALSL